MKFELNQKQISHKYGPPSSSLYIGKWKVSAIEYSLSSGPNGEKYEAKIFLPGLKTFLGYFETIEKAKEKIQFAVDYWFEKLEE